MVLKKKTGSAMLVALFVLAAVMSTGCTRTTEVEPSNKAVTEKITDKLKEEATPTPGVPSKDDGIADTDGKDDKEITEFTINYTYLYDEPKDENEIREIIAEKTGVKVRTTWTADREILTADEWLSVKKLPDYLYLDNMSDFYEKGLLVPWDEYLDKYENLRNLYSEEEWDMFRQEDGHIYWTYSQSTDLYSEEFHNGSAFWIQVRVLEWAGYPEIQTLDEYFDLLERYYAENKTFINGEGECIDIIPYAILCDDWRYFCLENAPGFLEGTYNNGASCIVDTVNFDKPTVVNYDLTATAKRYFERLNTEYQKGMIYADFDTQSYASYIDMLATGAVLGMNDQYWDFASATEEAFADNGLADIGCDYVPLGLTIEDGMEQHYHAYSKIINRWGGIAVTTSCADPDLAFKFLNDILGQDIQNLRFWGIEGVDYLVDDDGMFYRTGEMRSRCAEKSYSRSHLCEYSNFPQKIEIGSEGKNATHPYLQESEILAGYSEPVANCLKAYGAGNYVDFVGSVREEADEWFPLYTFSSIMDDGLPYYAAYVKIQNTKHEWLPQIVKAPDFEEAWNGYLEAYGQCNAQAWFDEMQNNLDWYIEPADRKTQE